MSIGLGHGAQPCGSDCNGSPCTAFHARLLPMVRASTAPATATPTASPVADRLNTGRSAPRKLQPRGTAWAALTLAAAGSAQRERRTAAPRTPIDAPNTAGQPTP